MESTHKIKHLVLSGGGEIGFAFYGALKQSNLEGFWSIDRIETIHGTSVGGIYGTFISLLNHMTWEEYDTLMYCRPWGDVYNCNMENVLGSYQNIGILGRKTIIDTFYPVFTSLDLSMEITLAEFYDFTGIEMHYYTTNLDTFELVNVSYKTHPDWPVVDAIYASCALPILFRPNKVGETQYADGAIFCNYPVKHCIEIADHPDEIMGFKKVKIQNDSVSHDPNNLLEYLSLLLGKLLNKIAYEGQDIKHCIKFPGKHTDAYSVYRTTSNKDEVRKMIEYGKDIWTDFYRNLCMMAIHNNEG
jgi:predicted acylesterase/phospholipase RssA